MESKYKVYEILIKELKRGLDLKCVFYVLKIEVGLKLWYVKYLCSKWRGE